MRLLALTIAPLFLLAACGDESGEEAQAPASSAAAGNGQSESDAPSDDKSTAGKKLKANPEELKSIRVSGAGGKAPKVSLPRKPISVDKTTTHQLSAGKGEEITDKDKVTLSYEAFNGTNGDVLTSTFKADQTVVTDMAAKDLMPGLKKALKGQKPGAQLVAAVPPKEGLGETTRQQFGMSENDSIVFYIEVGEIVGDPLPMAEGKDVPPKDGLPTVEADGKKPAKITIPDGEKPPSKLTVQPLIEGEGAEIKKGQTVTVQYTGVKWSDGKQFDSSLERGEPFQFRVGDGQVIKAWDEGLEGQKVGSRVLIVAPPKDAYGDKGQGGGHELAGEDLVFVVDILQAY